MGDSSQMELRPFLSIIIPMYNSEKYLSQCLDSILCQDDPSYEVVLVDDGSTDDSPAIARAYADRDSRFKLFRQENAGTSAARNAGIAMAEGEYITFMDNDDFWRRKDAVSSIRSVAECTHADLIAHEAVVFHDAAGKFDSIRQPDIDEFPPQSSGKDVVLDYLLKHNLLTVTVWSKVCSAQLVKRANLLFPDGMRNEDTLWVFRAMLHANDVAWCSNSFYAYRCGHGYAQTSKPITEGNVSDLAKVIRCCIEEMEGLDLSSEAEKSLFAYLAYAYLVWMAQSTLCRSSYVQGAEFAEMKKLRYLVKYDQIPAVRLAKRAMKVTGFEVTRLILGRYLLHRYPTVGQA